MKATITTSRKPFNPNYRRDNGFCREIDGIAVVDGQIKEVVTVRCYATQSRTYCAVWVYANGTCHSGTDYAGGYGYHRASAAMQGALYNAGIDLEERISGCGDTAMKEAVKAIVSAVYPAAEIVHVIDAYA